LASTGWKHQNRKNAIFRKKSVILLAAGRQDSSRTMTLDQIRKLVPLNSQRLALIFWLAEGMPYCGFLFPLAAACIVAFTSPPRENTATIRLNYMSG
jgi:hypothetical protein